MTVIINTQEELEALIDKNNNIIIDGDLTINCSISIEANINACNIDAINIYANNIDANNIDAINIYANNIDANNIDVHNISYDTFCIAHQSLKCKTIKGRRENALHACLDQPIEYIK